MKTKDTDRALTCNSPSSNCRHGIKSEAIFELKSMLGRLLFSKKPKIKVNNKYLHLGSGQNRYDGWVNADFFIFKPTFIIKRPDWMLDLRYPLNCDDNTWDGVFTEHTLEHLYPNEADALLRELYRTMKPGAWIRISVPDLAKYVRYYLGDIVDDEFLEWSTGCEAIRSLTQDWGHHSVWDPKLLMRVLADAGFGDTNEVSFRVGSDPMLNKDSEDRRWESLYVEARKSYISTSRIRS